jgi:hypothetical protein
MASIDVNEYFFVNDAGDTITGTKKTLYGQGYIKLPPEITTIQNISNGYSKGWFGDISTLEAPNVTEVGDSSLINCINLQNLKLPLLVIIKTKAFSGTKLVNVDFRSNSGLLVDDSAFENVTLGVLKLPTDYVLKPGAFLNTKSTSYTVYSEPTTYTEDRDTYFIKDATIKPYSVSLTQMSRQITQMNAKINKMSKKQQLMMKLIKRMVNKNLR